MGKLIVLALIIVVFSVVTIAEVLVLQAFGLNIIAHLNTSYDKGGTQFYFEAAGVVAFILAQPIIFFVLIVWGASTLRVGTHLTRVWSSLWHPVFPDLVDGGQ
jgi:hypothetical protein